MQLELLLLTFLRPICQANFSLYVHLLDMCALPQTASDVARRFDDGFFISAVAIDQLHEQNHAIVKGDGSAGLTENPSALRCWMVSGPEIVLVVNEFENEMKVASSNDVKTDHHEENRSF